MSEISKLFLLRSDELVNFRSTLPKLCQVCAFRLKSQVETLGREEFLTADETGEKLKAGPVAHIQLLPHVQYVVQHAVVANAFSSEHALDLVN